MSALFHFGFELFKIAALSAVYAFLVYSVASILGSKKGGMSVFFRYFIIIAVILFVFQFTYYGNHGLGDNSILPIGHGKTVRQGDDWAYFTPAGRGAGQIHVNSFAVRNSNLCASTDDGFFFYNLAEDKMSKFASKGIYNSFASVHNLPSTGQFQDFNTQYAAYWNGWRFWTMP